MVVSMELCRRSHKVADAFLDFEPTNNNARPSLFAGY